MHFNPLAILLLYFLYCIVVLSLLYVPKDTCTYDFKDTLADMLRDRLVCGCRDRRLQCKLLAEKDLTFDQALAIAKALKQKISKKAVTQFLYILFVRKGAIHRGEFLTNQ